ncbi:PREDICTED: tenascin-R-like [Priapulus caudatus]|uniref:Tenascin-R-like n=1 Tax=Priapulus caudatus TaxID=37621 RepID=A0ABM1EX12_PRICU|nr:PREDICTED: tenascin-R-like [Priapulus caudatus]
MLLTAGEEDMEAECIATNMHGTATLLAYVQVNDPPRLRNMPKLAPENGTTAHSITVYWEHWQYALDDGGNEADPVEYKAIYRESSRSNSKKWQDGGDWSAALRATVTGLNADTAYDVAIQSKVFAGRAGKPGPWITTRTLCDDPPDDFCVTCHELEVVHVTSSEIRVTWEKPNQVFCGVAHYYIGFNTSDGHYRALPILSSVNQYTVRYLKPFTDYTISLKAVTSANFVSAVYGVNVTTAEDHEYITNSNSKKWQDGGDWSAALRATVTGLNADTAYDVAIQSKVFAGRAGKPGPWITTRTLCDDPPDDFCVTCHELEVVHVTSSEIRVTWEKPNQVFCGVAHYYIGFNTSDGHYRALPILSSVNQYTVRYLKPFTDYTISLKAVTSANFVSAVYGVNVTTAEDPPGAVGNVRAATDPASPKHCS